MADVGQSATLASKSPEPVVLLGFGAILSMTQKGPDERSGLLSQTGFNLDLAGTHQFSPYYKGKPWLPSMYVTGRIGLMSDQDLVVQKEGDAATLTADAQVGEAIRQADQIALTVQADYVWQAGSRRQEAGFYLGGGRVYAQPEPIGMPLIPINDSVHVAAEDVFGASSVARALSATASSIPLGELSTGITLRFLKSEGLAFYIGAGYQLRGVPRQGITFRRDANNRIDSLSLRGFVTSEFGHFSQFMIGVRVPGIVEIRADAHNPISLPELKGFSGRRSSAPAVLRLVITRPFPLTK